jgi:hypothetical protein
MGFNSAFKGLIDISQRETYCQFNSRREVGAHKKNNSPNAFLHEI